MAYTKRPMPPVTPQLRADSALLDNMPVVLPAIFESWDHTASLEGTWRRIHNRLGNEVRAYLPRQRCYHTNGKLHVREAFDRLSQEGLFVQHVIRYTPVSKQSINALIILDRLRATRFLESVQGECWSIAAHPGGEHCLLRLTGDVALFDAILGAGHQRVYWMDRTATETCAAQVRFAYDQLFLPKRGEWVLPEAKE